MHDILRGSRKDVYSKLQEILEADRQPSIVAISHCTGWSIPTVQRSLSDLRSWGLIDYRQDKPGQPAEYQILREV
jgi:Mn-dependent DtxR family transcriptional regulator